MLKNILYLSIFTAFAVLSWLGFNIYHNFSVSTLSTSTNIKIIPITPVFDAKTLSTLKTRRGLEVDLKEKVTLPEVRNSTSSIFRPSPTPSASKSAVFQIPALPSSTSSSQITPPL